MVVQKNLMTKNKTEQVLKRFKEVTLTEQKTRPRTTMNGLRKPFRKKCHHENLNKQ